MCYECWEEYGSPEIVNECTKAAAKAAREVYNYPMGAAGGRLHIVLDDWNIEDHSLRSCEEDIYSDIGRPEEWIQKNPFYNRTLLEYENQLQAEIECLKLFKALTIGERASALAILDEFFNYD